jgi:low affinity Fe/Cu permease
MEKWFSQISKSISVGAGRPATFIAATAIIVIWALSGPMFHYSNTWQLVINTGTTIVTFLMVFLIQNTQNRESMAMQLKLNEIIRVLEDAHNGLLDLEELPSHELQRVKQRYGRVAAQARSIPSDNAHPLVDPGQNETTGGEEPIVKVEIEDAPSPVHSTASD